MYYPTPQKISVKNMAALHPVRYNPSASEEKV